MPLILGTNSIKDTGYDVANSCRFDRASTDNMTKSMSDGSSIKGTFSAWIKVDGTGNEMNILSHFEDTNNVFTIGTSGSGVNVIDYNDAYTLQLSTNRLMRDPSAWFHLYIAIDRTQGTANARNRMFINGVEETSFSNRTNYGQQTSGSHQDAISMNDGDCTMYVGGLGDGNQMFGGYMAEVVWLDGTASAVTNFGEFDEDSGIWKPIDVSGLSSSKGTNGFYLDFEDASNLGNDAFGGTDLGENNIIAANQSTDTCTNNFATINPLHFGVDLGTVALSEGNTTFSNSGNDTWRASTIAVSQGKWYAEFKITSRGTGGVGINNGDQSAYIGSNSFDYVYLGNGIVYNSDDDQGGTFASFSDNNIIGVAVDLDNNKIYFSINGTFQNSSDPTSGATGTGAIAVAAASTNGTGFYHLAVGDAGTGTVTFLSNFGNPSVAPSSGNADANGFGNFEYAVPSGYFSLNTKNLAEFG